MQAGERTSHLFRLANFHGGLVVGTGDLSELALGWCTYGVGDHMSHYNVNASVPKTLIQHLIALGRARPAQFGAGRRATSLDEILDTEISPELVPGDDGEPAGAKHRGERRPYELQDFHLYYMLRYGYPPTKVAFLACTPGTTHDGRLARRSRRRRNQYDLAEIRKYLGMFL